MSQHRLFTDEQEPRFSPAYRSHLQSIYWSKLRAQVFRLVFHRCQFPGCAARATEVHHLNYNRLGRERVEDCEALCRLHHERRERDKVEARNRAAMETYMLKKYGENWRDRIQEHEAWEDFEFWLERKGVRSW